MKKNWLAFCLPLFCLSLAFLFSLPLEVEAFQIKGLKTPESFISDPDKGNFFISNINGKPTDKDHNGFITKLDEKGKVIDFRFIDAKQSGITLHAPKGLDIIGNTLYVTDIDFLRGFDKESGKTVCNLDLRALGASFLNDLTHDAEGNLYITDMMSNMILKVDTRNDYETQILVKDEMLQGPNGIALQSETGNLIVVTWNTGSILEVNPQGQIKVLMDSKGLRKLDGIALDDAGNLYTSSFTDGKIYRISANFKRIRLFKEGLTTPADINLDHTRQLVLIPLFDKNQAQTEKIR